MANDIINMDKFHSTQQNLTELASNLSVMATEYAWSQSFIHLVKVQYPDIYNHVAPIIDKAFDNNEEQKQTG